MRCSFRFLGYCFPLAMSNVGWLLTEKFVILVPDPIVFAPWSVLYGCTASFCDICQHTSSRPPFAGLSVAPWNKDDMGDGVPTDQLSHNHCDCTDSHCRNHIVASCVFVLLGPTAITRRRRRVPSTMSTSPSSSTRASLVSLVNTRSVKTHFARPPSQDRLNGRVCPRNGLSQKETHIICARSLLGEIEDDTGGTVLRPITSPSVRVGDEMDGVKVRLAL